MHKFLILLFLSLSLSSPVLADKAYDLYQEGKYEEAIIEWEKIAYTGDTNAQNNLGIIYSSGTDVKKDCNKAIFWFRRAVNLGFPNSEYNLGTEYISGDCLPIDNIEGVRLITKSAEQGFESAQHYLGNLYKRGKIIPKNDELAFKWYSKAAAKDHKRSQYTLGYSYQYGDDFIKQDYQKAFKWYQKAATQFTTIKAFDKAVYKMGEMYEYGYGTVKNLRLAKSYYNKASKLGVSGATKALERIDINEKNAIAIAKKEAEEKKKADEARKAIEEREAEEKRLAEERRKQLEAEILRERQKFWAIILSGVIALWILIRLMGRGKRERERQLRIDELARIADRKKKEEERIQREKEEEERRIRELAIKEKEKRIYALQQKKLVYLKADKYLSEFESHLPFKLSANYSDLRVFYDEESSTTQTSFTENETSFKDGKLWDALISLLVDDHSLDTMSTIYFAKIRSLLDDENYFVIGETDLDINEFFDRSTQLELVDLISNCLMPKPIALFVILHLSREFRYPNEEERADTEFKLEHFIVKENAKVKIQKLFTKFDEYAIKCVDSYADISSKEYDELESNEIND